MSGRLGLESCRCYRNRFFPGQRVVFYAYKVSLCPSLDTVDDFRWFFLMYHPTVTNSFYRRCLQSVSLCTIRV